MNRNFAGAGSFGRATFGPATTLGLASLPFAAKKKRAVGGLGRICYKKPRVREEFNMNQGRTLGDKKEYYNKRNFMSSIIA